MFDLLDYLSLILIFVFGVPHGAFDASIALTLGYYENIKSKFFFGDCLLTMYKNSVQGAPTKPIKLFFSISFFTFFIVS